MKVNYAARIALTSDELKILLAQQKTTLARKKVQAIYWLKSGISPSITHVAQLLGVHRTTVQRWLKKYHNGGLEQLLEIKPITGRPQSIPAQIVASIKEKISQEYGGFKSYKEIGTWLEQSYNLSVKYSTIHNQVRYRLKAKLKVPRPDSTKKDPTASLAFKKN